MNGEPQYNPRAYGHWRFQNTGDGTHVKLWHPKLDGLFAVVDRTSRWRTWFEFDQQEVFTSEDMYYIVQVYGACGWIN